MKSMFNKVFVVTGAGSGIGRHLAIQLAELGARLALTDINQEALDETVSLTGLNQDKCFSKKLDVSKKAAFYKFAEQVDKHFGAVHGIINNAGVTVVEMAEDTTYEDFEWLMNINFWGVVYGTKAFLPYLKQQDEAVVVNISSVFGLFGYPSQSAYNASKFAVRGYTEALRLELKDTSVVPICVHPGGIRTNISKNARFHKGVHAGASHQDMNALFDKMARTLPEQAAATIINAIKKKKRRVLIGKDAHVFDVVTRLLPDYYDKLIDRLSSAIR